MDKYVNTKIIIDELHKAFTLFNEKMFGNELPEPAILIQSRGNKKLTLGWCTVAKVWKNENTEEEKYEINLVAEGLNRGIYPVMATLLHEMVHLYNLTHNVKDVTRGGTYHNKKFKERAELSGLNVEHDNKIGWSLTSLQGWVMDLIDSHDFDKYAFKMARRSSDVEGTKDKPKKKSSVRKYVCPSCGCIIRASKLVNVICGDCFDHHGKVVRFQCEEAEEGTEEPTSAPVEEPTTEEPITEAVENVTTAEQAGTYVCMDCGSISDIAEGEQLMCKECESENIEKLPEEPQPTEKPEEKKEEPQEPQPTELEPEKVQNSGWNMGKLIKTMTLISQQGVALGLKNCFPNGIEIEISEKMKSQYATYKEGKKIVVSADYLSTASDDEIMETLKHEYLHHYQFTIDGVKMNHKKEFKALCAKMGISENVPLKNHRAMI